MRRRLWKNMRINKYISSCGICARRKADILIDEGKVEVNGVQIGKGYNVEEGDNVLVNGKAINGEEHCYFMVNKPLNYLSAASDERKDVVTSLVKSDSRLFPVGRLDYDSEGLVILTNDGDFTNRVLHPKYKVVKEYLVVVEGEVNTHTLAELESGVMLKKESTKTLPASFKLKKIKEGKSHVNVKIKEGRKRQIRRMFALFGHRTFSLKRIAMGPLRLGTLRSGEYRQISTKEINKLIN